MISKALQCILALSTNALTARNRTLEVWLTASSNSVRRRARKKKICAAKTASSSCMELDRRIAKSMEKRTSIGNAIIAALWLYTTALEPLTSAKDAMTNATRAT